MTTTDARKRLQDQMQAHLNSVRDDYLDPEAPLDAEGAPSAAEQPSRALGDGEAVVEAAARVLSQEHRFHGSTCLGCGFNARLDGYRAAMHQAQALADAGLLADRTWRDYQKAAQETQDELDSARFLLEDEDGAPFPEQVQAVVRERDDLRAKVETRDKALARVEALADFGQWYYGEDDATAFTITAGQLREALRGES